MNWKKWKESLHQDPEILGGELCFPDTRLSVRHIGQRIYLGESIADIRQDYPELSEQDCQFAGALFSIEKLEEIASRQRNK